MAARWFHKPQVLVRFQAWQPLINMMTIKTKSKGGRPTVMTEKTLEKLEEAFKVGATDEEACLNADIDPKTLYNYCDKNTSFSSRKELLKNQPNFKSKINIVEEINNGDVAQSKWWLEKKDKEFQPTSKIDLTAEVDLKLTEIDYIQPKQED